MTTAPTDTKPVGFLKPTHDRAALAVKALSESRWDDAAKHIRALDASDPIVCSWRAFLEGDLLFRQGFLREAEPLLLRAASLGLGGNVEKSKNRNPGVVGTGDETEVRVGHAHPGGLKERSGDQGRVESAGREIPAMLRLAAAAIERLGVIRRRFEDFAAAERAHGLALALRKEHGSIEEQWQSAASLGLNFLLAGRWANAISALARAAELARAATENSLEKRTVTAEYVARAYSGAAQKPSGSPAAQLEFASGAVAAGREALRLRHDLDPSSAAVPIAQLHLGQALVRLGELRIEHMQGNAALSSDAKVDDGRMGTGLSEAVALLREAHDSLLAFGPTYAAEAAKCARLLDFAERLQASLD